MHLPAMNSTHTAATGTPAWAFAPMLPLDVAYPIMFHAAALEARGPAQDEDQRVDSDDSEEDTVHSVEHTPNVDRLVSLLLTLPPTAFNNRDHASSHRTLQRIVIPHLPWLSQYRASESGNLTVLDWWRNEAPIWTPLPFQCVRLAIENGHLPVVQWWWTSLSSTPQTRLSKDRSFFQALDLASQYARLDILDWMAAFGPQPPTYTHEAVDRAPSVHVLEWWLKRNLEDGWEPKFTVHALVKASVADNAQEMLDWWLDRAHAVGGWPFHLTRAILHTASTMGNVAALEWWKNRGSGAGIAFRLHDPLSTQEDPDQVTSSTLWYSHDIMDGASANSKVYVLDWWLHSGFPLAHSEAAITDAAWHGHDDVLRWWKKAGQEHGIQVKFNPETAISYASSAGRIHVLDWLLDESGWPFEYTHDAVDYAAAEGWTQVLDWWWSRRRQLPFRYSEAALDRSCQHKRWDVADWFLKRDVEPKCTTTALDMVILHGQARVLKAWEAAGWPARCSIQWDRVLKIKSKVDESVFADIESWWKRQGWGM